jgi:hypothetical protein
MPGFGRLISISALAIASLSACKTESRATARAEPAAMSPVNAAPSEAAGVCGAAEAEKAGSCGCEHGNAGAEKSVVPMSQAKVGDRTLCPVMNTVFTVLPDSPKAEVDGKTYYFCCDGCANKFKENPKRFIDS